MQGVGKRGEMTPQELERLGIAITGLAEKWIAPLAKLLGVKPANVRSWSSAKTRISAPRQRAIRLLAGQADAPLAPMSEQTRNRLAQIMAMRNQGHTDTSIGRVLGVTRQAVGALLMHYRLVKPAAELSKLPCPVCSKAFRPKSRRQKYCSKHCGRRGWHRLHYPPRPHKPCVECASVFQPLARTAKYCSRRCYNRRRFRLYYQRRRAKTAA